MTGKDAWSIIAPLLGSAMEKNPVLLEAYATTYMALGYYDMRKQNESISGAFTGTRTEYASEKAVNAAGKAANTAEAEPGAVAIGQRINDAMWEMGISRRKLAEMCSVTDVTMSKYIMGEQIPKATTLIDIAKVLEVRPEYLVYGDEGLRACGLACSEPTCREDE